MAKVIHICTQEMVDCHVQALKAGTALPATLCGCVSTAAARHSYISTYTDDVMFDMVFRVVSYWQEQRWVNAWGSDLGHPTCPACLLIAHTEPDTIGAVQEISVWWEDQED